VIARLLALLLFLRRPSPALPNPERLALSGSIKPR
jgi:hypothetical protein